MSGLERELGRLGYTGLFLTGDSAAADALWAGGAGRAPLEAIAVGNGDALERVLASELLYAYADDFPGGRELGPVYADALALTGARGGPLVLNGNLWGLLYDAAAGDHGPLGAHLLATGDSALAPLRALLDDSAPFVYEGSEEATIGNGRRYRVKDAAAYYLGELTGHPVPFHDELEQRDAEIERLKT